MNDRFSFVNSRNSAVKRGKGDFHMQDTMVGGKAETITGSRLPKINRPEIFS